MTTKQLLVVMLILTMIFSASIVGFVWVYRHHPELIGMPTPPPTAAQIQADSLVKIHQQLQIDSITIKAEWAKKAKEEQDKHEKDSLVAIAQKMSDSVAKLTRIRDSLRFVTSDFQAKYEQMERNNSMKMDTLTRENYMKFAKIYDNANPPEVAKILENVDERDASIILKMMKKKNAGKVLESMNPNKAASILSLGSIDF